MFNEGSELKTGLINVAKGYEYIIKNKKETKVKTTDSIDLIPSNQVAKRMTQGQKWSRILEYMRKNPQALMQAIPSPRPGEKPKELALPNFGPISDNLSNCSKPSVPAIGATQPKMKPQSEKEHSMGGSSHFSKRTSRSGKRRSNKNSVKMVMMKPVPVPQSNNSSSKKYKFRGNRFLMCRKKRRTGS